MELDIEAQAQARGQRALAAGDWEEARLAFGAALAETESAAALDGLGRALWWLGDVQGALEHRERAYALHRAAGDDGRAGAIAIWLAREHLAVHGNEAVANGWLARADRLLPKGSAERGWLDIARGRAADDPNERGTRASAALALARKADDADLEVAALAELGLAAIESGRVGEGLDLLDEAMAAATGGEANMLETVAEACCSLVAACELAGDAGRLEQWARIVATFVERRRDLPLLAFCRTCNAEMLAATGRREEAERELLGSISQLSAGGHRSRCVDPAVKLAEVRLLQGRSEEASALLEGREALPEAAIPAADLALVRGDTALAASRLLRRLNQVGRDGLLGAALLSKLVEVQLVQGDVGAASATASELAAAAEDTGHPMLRGYAELAAGRVAATRGEPAEAHLRAALDRFTRLDLPLEAARTRLELARTSDDPAIALAEARAALDAFDALGATSLADEAAALVRAMGGPARTGRKAIGLLSKRELEVLRLLGEGLTNAEIAARLFISTKTAGHHVSSILAKLHVSNRTEAAAVALRHAREISEAR
jgi:DNA-binding CsgD family transcriptional regulator